jgi:hypothetical protein
MRQVNGSAATRLSLVALMVLGSHIVAKADTACSPVATFKYPEKKCTISVNRAIPGSPLPVQVPSGTTVTIVVTGQRKTEIIKTTTTTDAVATPDFFGNALKQFSSPLGSVLIHAAVPRMPLVARESPLSSRQLAMKNAFQSIADDVLEANQRIACLQAFTLFDENTLVCTQTPLPVVALPDALQAAKDSVSSASTESLPNIALQNLDNDVKAYITAAGNCPVPASDADPNTTKGDCDIYLSNQNQLDASIKSLATLQSTLGAFGPTLDALDTVTDTTIPPVTNSSNFKATITITAQEQIGKTAAAVATVQITWLQSNWSLSTGVVLSSLANQSFNNSPQYANNAPVIDGSGKTPTIVTITQTYPGAITPVFLVNYRLKNFQRNQGRWAFLASAGMGLNPTTKTADFATGFSFQFGNVLFGPVLHYGRQTNLTNGVKVGDQLGDSPPTLPTSNILKPAGGISITYRLPIT